MEIESEIEVGKLQPWRLTIFAKRKAWDMYGIRQGAREDVLEADPCQEEASSQHWSQHLFFSFIAFCSSGGVQVGEPRE